MGDVPSVKSTMSRMIGSIGSICLFLSAFVIQTAHADENFAEIISVKNTAWASRTHQSVKTTVRAGDIVYIGDIIEVMPNNNIEIAFDQRRKNIIHIVGPTSIEITRMGEVDVNMKNGKLFAFLDNQKGRQFQVTTPTAISSVRGTHFQVKADASITHTLVYEGAVEIAGRMSDGSRGASVTMLNAGEKGSVKGRDAAPGPKTSLLTSERQEADGVLKQVNATVIELNESGIESRIGESTERDPVAKVKDSESHKGQILY